MKLNFKKILDSLITLSIIVIPLLTFYRALGYEQIKVLAIYFSVFITLILWLILFIRKKVSFNIDRLDLLAFFFLAWLTFTSVLSQNLELSFIGTYPYHQGILFYLSLFLLSLIIKSLKIDIKKIALGFTFSAILVSTIAIFQFFELNILKKDIFNYAGRVISTFGQPNLYAGFLVLTLPFITKIKKYSKVILVLLIIGILVSLSRTAIIISFIFIIFLLWNIKKRYSKLLIIFSLIGTVFYLALIFKQEFIKPLDQEWLINNSAERRIFVYRISLDAFLKKPLIGYGVDNIPASLKPLYLDKEAKPSFYHSLRNLNIERSHNYYLDILLFSGLPALILYLTLIVSFYLSTNSQVIKIGLVLFSIWSLFQIHSSINLLYFWILFGMRDTKDA